MTAATVTPATAMTSAIAVPSGIPRCWSSPMNVGVTDPIAAPV
jgi:hypothetical protein